MKNMRFKFRPSMFRLALVTGAVLVVIYLFLSNLALIYGGKYFSYHAWSMMFVRYWLAIDPPIRYYFEEEPFFEVDEKIDQFVKYDMDAEGFRNWIHDEAVNEPLVSSAFIWHKNIDTLEVLPVINSPSDSALAAIKEYLDYEMDSNIHHPDAPDTVWRHTRRLKRQAHDLAGFTTYKYRYYKEISKIRDQLDSTKHILGLVWNPDHYRENVVPEAVENLREEYGFYNEPFFQRNQWDKKKRILRIGGLLLRDAEKDTVLHFGKTSISDTLWLSRIENVNSHGFNQLTRMPGWELYIQNWLDEDYMVSDIADMMRLEKPFSSVILRAVGVELLIVLIALGTIFTFLSVSISARKRQQKFIAHVSHELRTPVTKIRLFSETLRTDRTISPEQEKAYLDTILHESDHMSVLVDNTLNLVRSDEDRLRFNKVEIDTGEWLSAFMEPQLVYLKEQGFSADFEIPAKMPRINADRELLELVLRNLLDNAVKYSAEEKSVSVRVTVAGGKVRISVADQGIGIPAKMRRKVFRRFYRLKVENREQTGGIGIGLSLVREIIRAHKGKVWCEDNPGGAGSRFMVEVPVVKQL